MQTRKALMFTVATVALAATATAADAASSYVSLFGGASVLGKFKTTGSTTTYTQHASSSFKTGYVFGADYGVDWGSFRTELELGIRSSSAKKINNYYLSSTTEVTYPADLNLRTYTLLANAWYDFHGLPLGITPYVGGGLGLGIIQLGGSINSAKIHESNGSAFAWQLGTGVSVPVTAKIKLSLDYRYLNVGSASVTYRPSAINYNHAGGISGHAVLAGLRIGL